MADETNTTPAADSKEKAKPTTLDGMTGYRTFDSTDEAADYLKKCAADFSDFASQPFATVGFDSDGNFDPAVYTDQMRVRVAVLRNVPRSVNGKREPTTIKAIVVTPVPTIPSLLGIDGDVWDKVKDSPSVQFVTKTLDKELNHIAVRPLRAAENIETAVEQVPTTREAFITSSRDTGGIMDTFNETYKTINDTLSKQVPLWSKARLIKAELKKAMESKAYALEYYPELEDRGDGKDGHHEQRDACAERNIAAFDAELEGPGREDVRLVDGAAGGQDANDIEIGKCDDQREQRGDGNDVAHHR